MDFELFLKQYLFWINAVAYLCNQLADTYELLF